MASSNWQLAVALLIVAAALFVVGRRVVRFVRGKPTGGCGTGCGSCAPNNSTTGVTERPLVQLGLASPTEKSAAPSNSAKTAPHSLTLQ